MLLPVMNINQTNLDKGTEQLAKTEELSDKLHWHTTARKPTVENIHLLELTPSL